MGALQTRTLLPQFYYSPSMSEGEKCKSRTDAMIKSITDYYNKKIQEKQKELDQQLLVQNINAVIDLKNAIAKLKHERESALENSRQRMYRMIGYANQKGKLDQYTLNNYLNLYNQNANLDEQINLMKKTHTTDKQDALYTQISFNQIWTINFYLFLCYYLLLCIFLVVLFYSNTTYPFNVKILLSIFMFFVPMLRDMLYSIWKYFYDIYTKSPNLG